MFIRNQAAPHSCLELRPPTGCCDTQVRACPAPTDIMDRTRFHTYLLRRFAVSLPVSFGCKEVDDGDKSVSKPGVYYVHCGIARGTSQASRR